jgi:hypothetical protein
MGTYGTDLGVAMRIRGGTLRYIIHSSALDVENGEPDLKTKRISISNLTTSKGKKE